MTYPFSAIVGQEKLKKALLLCAINPGIGGVLIRGDKGTAKSTAARGLAEIAPPLLKTEGCSFNCPPESPLSICEACNQPGRIMNTAKAPFVNLPLGASEERVLGHLDLEGVLKEKKKKLQPGLLASANGGILYIDEVNLLPDHLVDVLLDVAAMGVNTIEREGLSESHPARFTLIGTMNMEEGNLRPQLLDRFGLMVDVEAPGSIEERTEVVRRRIAFDANRDDFLSRWHQKQQAYREQLVKAKALLSSVSVPDDLLTLISELCTGMAVKSLRADIVIYKTAVTIAALEGRTIVTPQDIHEAAALALAHRSHRQSFSEPAFDNDKLNDLMNNRSGRTNGQTETKEQVKPQQDPQQTTEQEKEDSNADTNNQEQVFTASLPDKAPTFDFKIDKAVQEAKPGRTQKTEVAKKGSYVRAEKADHPTDIAIDATILEALYRNPEQFEIKKEDVRQKIRSGKTGSLVVFVVDASGSMAAHKRMEAVKGSVLSLLKDAYQRRDEICVIAFRGIESKMILPPTRSIDLAETALNQLPTGGRTPLPHALETALQLVLKRKEQEGIKPVLILLSDGKANVPLSGGDPWQETLSIASAIKSKQIQGMVIDTDIDYLQLGRARSLAEASGFTYHSLSKMDSAQLTPIIQQLL